MNLIDETLVAFDESRKLPGQPSRTTLRSWRDKGVMADRNDPASVTRLECIKIGGRPFTSREAVMRFLAKLNDPM